MIRNFAVLILAVAMAVAPGVANAEPAVVLVTARDSRIESISMLDIRKAFLGIAVTVDGESLNAVRRNEDRQLDDIFLQSVVAMSRKSYERRLLSLALKFGTPRPLIADDAADQARILNERSPAISYMWRSEAEADSSVRILKVLWQES